MSYHIPQSSPLVAVGTIAGPLWSGGMGATASGTLTTLVSSLGGLRQMKKAEAGNAGAGRSAHAADAGEGSSVDKRI